MAEQIPKLEINEEIPLNKDVKVEKKEKSFRDKLGEVKDNITVEPLVAGVIISSVLSSYAMINLNLDKACRVNLGYNDEICDALVKRIGNYSTEEEEVQMLITSIDIWKGAIKTLLPCVIIMFLGAWSDRTGKRKLCILLPIFGELLTSINNIINVYFFYEIPVQATVFLETIFGAATGGWVTMFLGVFSYISDITLEETRTFRVGLVNFWLTAGVPIGIGVCAILQEKVGYYGLFSMTGAMFFILLIYGYFFLKEPEKLLKEKGMPVVDRQETKVSFFDVSHVVETVAVAFKKRINKQRIKVLLTLFTVFILYGPNMLDHNILYLFVRNRLNWDIFKFGMYTSYHIVLHSFGAIFSIAILSKKLQMDDSLLCLISVASKFVGAMWTAFVQTDVEMFLVPIVELLNATTFTSLRSIISKLVEKQETAKINSLFSLTETVAGLVFHPIYSWIYLQTLTVMPGAVFIFSAILVSPASLILIYFYIQQRKQLNQLRKKALDAEEKKELEEKHEETPSPLPITETKDKININGIHDKLDLSNEVAKQIVNKNTDKEMLNEGPKRDSSKEINDKEIQDAADSDDKDNVKIMYITKV